MRTSLGRWFPVSVLLIFLGMILWTCGGGDGPSPPAFSQADLAGTWDVIEFDTGSDFAWQRANVTVDGSGNINLNYGTDSFGNTWSGPPANMFTKWVINGSGTIREYDTSSPPDILNPSMYGNLASNKTLAVATDNDANAYVLRVVRKRVSSVTYGDGDINNKTFVLHQLDNGADNVWRYGYGRIGGSGNVTIDNVTSPSGLDPGYPQTNVDTIHVDPAGIVTNADNTFYGMLTVDKSTLFGLITEPSNPNPTNRFIVIQFLGQTYTQADLAGTWRWNVLLGSDTPGWVKGSWTIDATGAATYDSSTYLTNTGSTVPPTAPETLTISPDGIITNSQPVLYHGMLSSGKDLWVRTKTNNSTVHSIAISVR